MLGGMRIRTVLRLAVGMSAAAFLAVSSLGCGPMVRTSMAPVLWSIPHQATVPGPGARSRPRQVRGPLGPSGRWLTYPDGGRFRWRGVTGFMLNQLVSSRREADATAFLAWARETGFNVVRVFLMLPDGWFADKDFTPEEGLAALPRTLALALDADMYVQVTVLANTASLPSKADLGSYVERAGRICATAGNCALVEVAHQISDRAQRADVHDPGTLARWAGRIPRGIPVALGAPADESGEVVDAAPVITVRLDRGRDRWTRVARVRGLGQMSARTLRFVIDNEPLGAGETPRPQERDDEPAVFFAQGALSRVLEVGSNFHFEDGLRARVPGPIQQRCAEAFIAGTRIVDDSYMLTFQDAGSPYSPVQKAQAVAAYAGLTQVFPRPHAPSSVLVLIGVEDDPAVEWRHPWRQVGVVATLPRVQVWSIARNP